jgi:amino acid adenylation domain-containing protein/thioester reductase-like protein
MQAETIEGFRLSPQQKRLWLLEQDSHVYRAQCGILIAGKINLEVLQAALQQIINQHDIFRTTFHRRPGIKIPIQVIVDSSYLSWKNINLSDLDGQEQQNKIEELFQKEKYSVCKFEQSPLLRSCLLTLSEQQYILILTLPSLCADSWTIKNLIKEISDHYAAYLERKELPDVAVQYIQFSEWQNELIEAEEAKIGKNYWQEQNFVNQIPHILPFESQAAEIGKFEPDCYSINIDSSLVSTREAIATTNKTTISELLLVCWQTLLYRILKQSDIFVSTVFHGRNYEELHTTMGLLAKWLPIHCGFQDNFNFREILLQTSETLRNHNQYQEYFIWDKNPETTVNVVNLPISFEFEERPSNYDSDGVSFSLYQQYVCFDRFKIKLSCVSTETSLIAEFHYDTNLFSKADIARLAEQFLTLLASVANNIEATVSELEILSDRQRQQLLVEFNKTHSNYPKDKCIHHLFEAQVKQTPDNIAVVFGEEQLTYSELNTRANQLAHYLQKLGVGTETLVGIYLERSHLNIIAFLAILKAGAAYVPLDPALPPEALEFRLQDVQASVLLTQHSLAKQLPQIAREVICLDQNWGVIAQENQGNPQTLVKPENLAYAIFTSGSTGKPKAVGVEHQQLLNYLYAIVDRLNLPRGGSFATVSTFAADLGNTVIFPALCYGGCLHILSQEQASDPQALADYLRQHPIDCIKIVPSHLAALIASSPSQTLLPRQCLILGGEVSSWDLIEKIQAQVPKCQIFNHYGPTETTVGVLTYQVHNQKNSHNSHTVPLGKPLANTQMYVLDMELRPVPIGVPGELYIGGASLSRGYLNRPELTTECFIQNPFIPEAKLYKTGDIVRYLPDGNLEFLGRSDNQVKIRGFRIELGEIEATLRQHPSVQEVVVLATEEKHGDQRLVAYIVANSQQRLTNQKLESALQGQLRNFCLQKLSEYMLPSAFVFLKTLPLTPNGKIDRQALRAIEHTRPQLEQTYVAPRTPTEKQLAQIWTNLLTVAQVGIHDNFFELGGHSLLITQLLAKVRNTFQVELALREFFNAPTIADLAKSIDNKQDNFTTSPINLPDLNAEAVLDSEIRPVTSVSSADYSKPNFIFLTGATGFLGVFLLYELLQQTSANIYCLVRAETTVDGKNRLQKSLQSYLLWDESFSDRIIPVLGDLSQPQLGLSEQEFSNLASQIDVIYHNGAFVNFTYPYSQLKAANVSGTQEVLRLAAQVKVKPVHFISTIGVVGAADYQLKIIREDTPINRSENINSGYTQSKWVAEKLVTIAGDRGIPISIYRPGRISGHSITGVCNVNDHTFRMIKGCIQLGSAPLNDSMVNLTPIDYASKAIIYLSQQKASLGKVFHVVNPQPIHWHEVIHIIANFGYSIKAIAYEKWRSELQKAVERSPNNALHPLISTFADSETPKTNAEESSPYQLDYQNTLNGLAESSIICPPVNAKLLKTYFSYLIQSGFLNAPQFIT